MLCTDLQVNGCYLCDICELTLGGAVLEWHNSLRQVGVVGNGGRDAQVRGEQGQIHCRWLLGLFDGNKHWSCPQV